MTSFEIGLLILLVFFCVFSLVDRVCRCIENKTKAIAISMIGSSDLSRDSSFHERFMDVLNKEKE